MRMTQAMGLPRAAKEFLREFAERINYCEYCERSDGYKCDVLYWVGMFDDEPVFKYHLKDGTKAEEFVQVEIWHSGPMIWKGLRVGAQEFIWDQEDIDRETQTEV